TPNDMATRAPAAYALGKATKANAPGAISLLTSLTADPLPGPKIVALRSLGHVGDRELVPLLKEALHDTNDAVRATAAGALLHLLKKRKWVSPPALPPFILEGPLRKRAAESRAGPSEWGSLGHTPSSLWKG